MSLLAAIALVAIQPPAEGIEPAFEELVVTAERRTLAPLPEPIEQFRRHCFDATRRDRQPALPTGPGSEWTALEELEREALRLGPAVEAIALADPARGQRLVLTSEERTRPDGIAESRCSLIVVGGRDHNRLAAGMARLFGGSGTSRHIGHADGTPSIPGWSHLIWTAMPQRGSSAWRLPPGRGQSSFLVVTDLRFFDDYDYVLGDLKRSTRGPTDIAILSLSFACQAPR